MIYNVWQELLDFIIPSTGSNKELAYIALVLTGIFLIMLFKGGRK